MTDESEPDGPTDEVERERWPIGFMLLVGATALYLGWRLVQGIGVVIGWVTG